MTKLLKQKEKQATKKVNKTKPQKSASAKPSAPYTDQTEKNDIQNYCGVCNGYYYDYDSDDND